MRIAVAGATGNIGALTAAALARAGLDAALTGVAVVVDATSYTAADRDQAVAYFRTATQNLLAAEERVGVRHHVLLSIVGLDRIE
jgi:uncharacterized protein YbjT (DUF2867 family)